MTSHEVVVRLIDGEVDGGKARVITWLEETLGLRHAFLTSIMLGPAFQIAGEGFSKEEIVPPRPVLAAEVAQSAVQPSF